MDLIIFLKKKKLNRGGDITGLLDFTVKGSFLMKIYASIEAFVFAMYIIGSKRRCTIVNNFVLIVFKLIVNHLFVSLDMFDV